MYRKPAGMTFILGNIFKMCSAVLCIHVCKRFNRSLKCSNFTYTF